MRNSNLTGMHRIYRIRKDSFTMKNMKVMKKTHVVSECMRRNRIHPLTLFFVPISCLFVFFVVKNGFLCTLLTLGLVPRLRDVFVVKVPARPVKFTGCTGYTG